MKVVKRFCVELVPIFKLVSLRLTNEEDENVLRFVCYEFREKMKEAVVIAAEEICKSVFRIAILLFVLMILDAYLISL